MRKLTQYEQDAIEVGYSEDPTPTQAITIEWQYYTRYDVTMPSPSTFEANYYWEEMVFPSEFETNQMKVEKKYIDTPIYFASKDSPEPEVTGLTKSFMEIANDTCYWNPTAQVIVAYPHPPPNNAPYTQAFYRTTHAVVTPPQIWARRIKVYNFDVDGNVSLIEYYNLEEIMTEPSVYSPYTTSLGGKVSYVKEGGYYKFDLTPNEVNTQIVSPPASPFIPAAGVAESVIPQADPDNPIHLINNAREAADLIRQVTVSGNTVTNDVYGDRLRARQNLAEALWG